MSVAPKHWPKLFGAYMAVYLPVVTYALLHWGV